MPDGAVGVVGGGVNAAPQVELCWISGFGSQVVRRGWRLMVQLELWVVVPDGAVGVEGGGVDAAPQVEVQLRRQPLLLFRVQDFVRFWGIALLRIRGMVRAFGNLDEGWRERVGGLVCGVCGLSLGCRGQGPRCEGSDVESCQVFAG